MRETLFATFHFRTNKSLFRESSPWLVRGITPA